MPCTFAHGAGSDVVCIWRHFLTHCVWFWFFVFHPESCPSWHLECRNGHKAESIQGIPVAQHRSVPHQESSRFLARGQRKIMWCGDCPLSIKYHRSHVASRWSGRRKSRKPWEQKPLRASTQPTCRKWRVETRWQNLTSIWHSRWKSASLPFQEWN